MGRTPCILSGGDALQHRLLDGADVDVVAAGEGRSTPAGASTGRTDTNNTLGRDHDMPRDLAGRASWVNVVHAAVKEGTGPSHRDSPAAALVAFLLGEESFRDVLLLRAARNRKEGASSVDDMTIKSVGVR